MVMRNSTEWLSLLIAIPSLGAVRALVNNRGKPNEIAYCGTSTKYKLVITDKSPSEVLDETDARAVPRITFELK
ncbi:MAG: long-subunit acyl-CoA synthetase (AMP-forming) [Saprospiraceae bacterium]|jgi:long-subunit acyl-CoA synthetase (AMP-forming)